MKQIILKYTDPDGETEYIRFEGNIMFSVSSTAFNVFVKFSESLKDFKTEERLEIPVEFVIKDEDYNTLLNDDEAEDELTLLTQCEMERYFEQYLVSDHIAFDLNTVTANWIAPRLEMECSRIAATARRKEKSKREVAKFIEEIGGLPDNTNSDSISDSIEI